MKRVGVVLLLLARATSGQVQSAHFSSPSLARDVSLSVDLPPSYGKPGRGPFPVVYALHGLFESQDFWERRGLSAAVHAMWDKGEAREFVVVCVDGGNSFFVNSPRGRFEDLVAKDLVSYVESHYAVVSERRGRALYGVSMGGYGALRIAFKHPERYAVVATNSAMILEKAPTREEGAGRWQMAAFHEVFGDPIDPGLWSASDPLAAQQSLDPASAPAISFDCGASDRYQLFLGNTELHRRLEARGIAHTFALPPGDHGYEYVRSVLPRVIRFLSDHLP